MLPAIPPQNNTKYVKNQSADKLLHGIWLKNKILETRSKRCRTLSPLKFSYSSCSLVEKSPLTVLDQCLRSSLGLTFYSQRAHPFFREPPRAFVPARCRVFFQRFPGNLSASAPFSREWSRLFVQWETLSTGIWIEFCWRRKGERESLILRFVLTRPYLCGLSFLRETFRYTLGRVLINAVPRSMWPEFKFKDSLTN